jgi:membrane protease YdiL (CAAX protease family)
MSTIIYSPTLEELIFRGLPILFFGNNIFSWGMIISNLIFTIIHLPNVKKGKILLAIDVFVFANIMGIRYLWNFICNLYAYDH